MSEQVVHAEIERYSAPSKVTTVRVLGYRLRWDMRESPDDFEITVHPYDARDIKPVGMQRITIYVDGHERFKGMVEDMESSTAIGERTVTLAGRDHSLHLVDNEAPVGSVAKVSVQRYAERLIADHAGYIAGLDLDPEIATFKLSGKGGGRSHAAYAGTSRLRSSDFRVQPGTPQWDALNKLCKEVGVLPRMVLDRLALSRPNYLADAELYGDGIRVRENGTGNALSSTWRTSCANRYARYYAKETLTVPGPTKTETLEYGGPPPTEVYEFKTRTTKTKDLEAEVIDPCPAFWERDEFSEGVLVGRGTETREKRIDGNWSGDLASMRRAARAEAEKNILDGWDYSVSWKGLYAPSGALWTPDTMVQVYDDTHWKLILRDLFVVAVEQSQSDATAEPETTLELIPPDIWSWYDDESEDDYAKNLWQEVDF